MKKLSIRLVVAILLFATPMLSQRFLRTDTQIRTIPSSFVGLHNNMIREIKIEQLTNIRDEKLDIREPINIGTFEISKSYIENVISPFIIPVLDNSNAPLLLLDDKIIVDFGRQALFGDIVAGSYNHQLFIRKLLIDTKNILTLEAFNKNYDAIIIDKTLEFQLYGPLIGFIAKIGDIEGINYSKGFLNKR